MPSALCPFRSLGFGLILLQDHVLADDCGQFQFGAENTSQGEANERSKTAW